MNIKIIAFLGLALTTFAACSNTANKTTQNTSAKTTQANEEKTANVETAGGVVTSLPAFKITDVNGNIIDIASLKGKKVFVNLWATWCPPCRAEIPSIEKLQSKVDKQKIAFVMLSLDKNFELAKKFAKKNKMQLPVYYPAEGLPEMFKIDGIPATFIFNEKGELIKTNNGMDDYDTELYVQMLKS